MNEPRRFYLDRTTDVTGASGTGRVADGVLWPDGTVTIRWRGEHQSTVHWDNLASAERVHGHGGATRIVFVDHDGDDIGTTIFRLLPDDVLLIGNAGQCEEDSLLASVDQLRKDLPTAADVFVFAENIDVQVVRETSQYKELREELSRVVQRAGAALAVVALAVDALDNAPQSCRYHGTEWSGMRRGLPVCDSCQQPFRVKRALEAIRATKEN